MTKKEKELWETIQKVSFLVVTEHTVVHRNKVDGKPTGWLARDLRQDNFDLLTEDSLNGFLQAVEAAHRSGRSETIGF